MAISALTKLTAVIGNPVRHSLSPFLHNEIYAREKIDAVMLAFENADISQMVGAIRSLPIHLTAVTLPHKQSILPLLDEVDATAREIGSVNTVLNIEGKLKGFNTDVVGIAAALSDVELRDKNVLILGAGGAARAVAYHLKKSAARIHVCDRTADKARSLVESFGGTALKEDELGSVPFDCIVNATPVGMSPNSGTSPAPKEIIRPGASVFDLVYTPLETTLMKDAVSRGARAISGLTMFLAQAFEQERLWLGKDVGNELYTQFLKMELNNEQSKKTI